MPSSRPAVDQNTVSANVATTLALISRIVTPVASEPARPSTKSPITERSRASARMKMISGISSKAFSAWLPNRIGISGAPGMQTTATAMATIPMKLA